MQVVILAGGLSTRLGNITKTIPKSMVLFNNKPFIEYQIEELILNGVTDIIICVGFLSKKIINYFENSKYKKFIKFSYDGKQQLGTFGAITNAKSILNDFFFVMYGDSFLRINYKKMYLQFIHSPTTLMLSVYRNNNKIDKSNIDYKDGRIFDYNKNNNNFQYIDYGAFLIDKSLIDKYCLFRNHEDVFRENVYNKDILGYEVFDRFYQIGSIDGINEFKKYIGKHYDSNTNTL